MHHDLYGAQKKVWKMLKNRKKPINEFVQTNKVTKDVWEKYFRKLYNTEEAISIENYETNHQITLNEEEAMAKIKKLNNRTAPRTDLICFIDLTKAFDRVRLSDIINILIAKETPDTIVRTVRRLNMNNMTKVKAGDTYTEETPEGIRQGDSISPFLFQSPNGQNYRGSIITKYGIPNGRE